MRRTMESVAAERLNKIGKKDPGLPKNGSHGSDNDNDVFSPEAAHDVSALGTSIFIVHSQSYSNAIQ